MVDAQCNAFWDCTPTTFNVGSYVTSGTTMTVTLAESGKAQGTCTNNNVLTVKVGGVPRLCLRTCVSRDAMGG